MFQLKRFPGVRKLRTWKTKTCICFETKEPVNGTSRSLFSQYDFQYEMLSSVIRWRYILELAPAPLRSSYIRSFCGATIFFNRGKSWIELAKMNSSAPAELSTLKKNSLLSHTHALVSLYSAISAIQPVDKMLSQRDISHHFFYWRPSLQLLGLFLHTKWEFVFTQFNRHLTFQEFSVPPSVYSFFNFDRFDFDRNCNV